MKNPQNHPTRSEPVFFDEISGDDNKPVVILPTFLFFALVISCLMEGAMLLYVIRHPEILAETPPAQGVTPARK